MTERQELKHATLEPDQTLRFRALELAILSERELRTIHLGNTKAGEWVTYDLLKRADAFDAYITGGTMPDEPAPESNETDAT